MRDRTVQALAALAVAAATVGIASTPLAAQTADIDRVSIHGFLTQAYGVTNRHQLLGLSSDGTTDYRVAALQFRYDADRRAVVLQFSHERLGRSPIGDIEPDVSLDWVFYEHWLDDRTVVRAGRIRMPMGIFNEIRDVGTLLPFSRPPQSMYGEHTYASETVDGVMLGHRVPLGDWTVTADVFYGGWRFLQHDLATMAHVDGGYGGQVWLHTPIPGLRVGGGALRFDARDVITTAPGELDHHDIWRAAVEGAFTRFDVRAEYVYDGFHAGRADHYYAQTGFRLTEKIALVGQAEFRDLDMTLPPPISAVADVALDRDYAVGIRFTPVPNVVLKLEGHRYRGYKIEDEVLRTWADDPVALRYGLLSVSTSF